LVPPKLGQAVGFLEKVKATPEAVAAWGLEKGTKLNLFQKIDIFTKEIEINAARHAMEDAAKSPDGAEYAKLQRDWQPVLGEERFNDTMSALRNGEIRNDNVQQLAFMQLTEMQPVTMSNMPEQYLKMDKGRLLYTLHTFQLQQLDLIRRQIFRKMNTPGERKEGLQNLAGLLAFGMLANFGKDLIQDLITGKPLQVKSGMERTGDSILGLIGLNRYVATRFRTDPVKTIIDTFAPPITQFDAPAHDVNSIGDGRGIETLKLIPVPPFNDLLYYWSPWGKGSTLNAEAAKQDYRKRLGDVRQQAYLAHQSGDTDTAHSLLALYNDRRKQGPGDGRLHPLSYDDLHYPAPSTVKSENDGLKQQAVEAYISQDLTTVHNKLREINKTRRQPVTIEDVKTATAGG
jgi:hypothetical protein